jgi:hypothetical protein
MSERKFDISWLDLGRRADDPPPSRSGGEGRGDVVSEASHKLGPVIFVPGEQRLDARLRSALAEVQEAHVVDLAARLGVEFEDAVRSVLRLAARRELVIKQRDPVANDHLVVWQGAPAVAGR